MILQTNCSEATLRINVNDLEEAEIQQIIDMLETFQRISDDEDIVANDNNNKISEDTKIGGNFSEFSEERIKEIKDRWYDTRFSFETLFGIKIISISGNTPYNEGDWLTDQLNSFSFSDKLDFDWSES